MAWGLLWYYVCARKGIDARGVALWLGLGISIGGELGYGQYTAWIRGMFYVGDEIVDIAPWVGYAWFIIAGIGWGSTGAIVLGWTLSEKRSFNIWIARILFPAAVGYLGWQIVQKAPGFFFPNRHLGIYDGELDKHLERTVYTNTQNFVVACWWLGAVILAAKQKDKTTLVIGLLIGGGFGLGFMQAAIWCLGYGFAPQSIDWWKMWELNAGFDLGALYVIALYWWIRNRSSTQDSLPTPLQDWLRNVSLAFCAFLLFFVLFWGASSRGGVVLELYDENKVDQYQWPPGRIALFLPFAAIVIGLTLRRLWKITRLAMDGERWTPDPVQLSDRVTDTITIIALVGAISIWPSEIGILYALFLCLALFGLNRLNRGLGVKPFSVSDR